MGTERTGQFANANGDASQLNTYGISWSLSMKNSISAEYVCTVRRISRNSANKSKTSGEVFRYSDVLNTTSQLLNILMRRSNIYLCFLSLHAVNNIKKLIYQHI